ncbi:MAG: RNA 2',3'-cyclic phosphodiesterase [Phycisphaerae bacterium]
MRTFIAIDFDETIRRRIAAVQDRLRSRCPDLRWVAADRIHLTLKFLGEIRDEQVASVGAALDDLAGGCRPFEIAVARVGLFGSRGRPTVVWLGVEDKDARLKQCHDRCDRLLEPLGFPPEPRRFSPHLTLARNRSARRGADIREAVAAEAETALGTQAVTGVVLYQSVLSRNGPIYTPLSRHPFTGDYSPPPDDHVAS